MTVPKLDIVCSSEQVAQAVCAVCNISSEQLVYAPKSRDVNLARGLYCAVTKLAGIHPTDAAATIKRSRANVITVAKHYKGYLEVRDAVTTNLYNKIVDYLQSKQDALSDKQRTD